MSTKIQRSFIIGDSWLYYKIYSGTKTSDMLLTDVIKPVTETLIEKNIIDKWFFTRYADPKHHIRVRFHYNDPEHIEKIINSLKPYLKKLTEQEFIWKIQTDVYNRELERYGNNTIELAERLFYYDSVAITNFINLITGAKGEELRWLFGLRMVDDFLNCFQLTLENKYTLLKKLKISFGNEFSMNRFLKKQLDDKYRKKRNKIERFLFLKSQETQEHEPLYAILQIYENNVIPIAEKILYYRSQETLQVDLADLLGSFIHMTMNRLFKSKNRVHEMVCYDFLYRQYKSALVRSNMKFMNDV